MANKKTATTAKAPQPGIARPKRQNHKAVAEGLRRTLDGMEVHIAQLRKSNDSLRGQLQRASEIENAIIKSVAINDGERGIVTAWLDLKYGCGGQSFGGFVLHVPKDWAHYDAGPNYTGHFISACMRVAGVTSWSDIPGKSIRVRHSQSRVDAIGHIIEDKWFEPTREFEELKQLHESQKAAVGEESDGK